MFRPGFAAKLLMWLGASKYFSLLSEADSSLREAFAVLKTKGLFPRGVTYVIDREGIIRKVFSAQSA